MLKRGLLYIIIFLLLCVGLFFIVKKDAILTWWETYLGDADSRQVVARVESTIGQPKFRLPRKLVYKKLENAQSLRYYDTISTNETSKVTISFLSGLVLELEPNSILVLEKPSDGQGADVVISFLQGNFNVIKKGNAGKVLLTKENKTIDTTGRNVAPIVIEQENILVEETPTPTPKPAVKAIVKPTPKPIKKRKESLPDDYIASVVKKQKAFFNRCYAQHLRLNPNASGRMSLSFTISPNGSVNNARVLRTDMSDPRLQKCTLSVIERLSFRTFDGDPIVVNYPINFE